MFSRFLVAALTTAFTLTRLTTADLGINCRGSLVCGENLQTSNYVQLFYTTLQTGLPFNRKPGGIRDKRIYLPGNTIACHALQVDKTYYDGFCLFLQGNVPAAGVNGSVIKERLNDLIEHGCRDCGSVPLSGDNDPNAMGILTVNYVTATLCDGLC